MLYFLQSIDQFGVQQKLQIPPINPTQKSVFGGLVTLTLYSISLGYFLFQFVDWQQNNKLPKVTSLQQQINVEQKLNLQGVFAEISYFQELSHQIDPFDPQNMILQPLLVSSSSYYDQTIINTTFQSRKTSEGKTQNTLFIEDIVISNSPISSSEHKYINYQLTFGYCNPDLLQSGQNCANLDLINKFFLQDIILLEKYWINFFQGFKKKQNIKLFHFILRFFHQIFIIQKQKKKKHQDYKISIMIYLEQFDPRSKQITKIPKFFVFEMMQKSYFQNIFTLKSTDLILDDGFLFPNSNQQTYLSDLSVITTQFDQEYAQKTYGQEIIAVLYFNLDQIKTVNMVEYPKISEILADTGSIISWILSISCIVSKYNENLSVEKTQKDIITMYYHDFNDFIIQKNWMGHIIKVNYKGKEYDLKKSEEIINKLDTIAIKKMNYLNLQNEVAKLQLILQEHLGVQQIKKYLQSQYKLESLFDKLGIPDINYQSSLNQILPQIDEQLVQNSQIQPEILNDSTNNKDKTLALELQERMQILDLQVHQNPTASIFSND